MNLLKEILIFWGLLESTPLLLTEVRVNCGEGGDIREQM
jgi:hypothetical protein